MNWIGRNRIDQTVPKALLRIFDPNASGNRVTRA